MKTDDAFPEPIGGYAVGRTQMDVEYTASDHSKRELTAFVYYPSDSSEGKTTSTYMFSEVYEMLNDQPLVTEKSKYEFHFVSLHNIYSRK